MSLSFACEHDTGRKKPAGSLECCQLVLGFKVAEKSDHGHILLFLSDQKLQCKSK